MSLSPAEENNVGFQGPLLILAYLVLNCGCEGAIINLLMEVTTSSICIMEKSQSFHI